MILTHTEIQRQRMEVESVKCFLDNKQTGFAGVFMLVLSLAILVGAFAFVKLEKTPRPANLPRDCEYLMLDSECFPRVQANRLLVTSDGLYVQFEGNAYSLVNAYSLDGTFQYGFQYEDHTNGTSCIGYDGTYFWIGSHNNVTYALKDGVLEERRQLQNSREVSDFEAMCDASSNHILGDTIYVLTSDGVYSTALGGTPLISLPPVIPVSYAYVLSLICFCIGLEGCLQNRDKLQSKKREQSVVTEREEI